MEGKSIGITGWSESMNKLILGLTHITAILMGMGFYNNQRIDIPELFVCGVIYVLVSVGVHTSISIDERLGEIRDTLNR